MKTTHYGVGYIPKNLVFLVITSVFAFQSVLTRAAPLPFDNSLGADVSSVIQYAREHNQAYAAANFETEAKKERLGSADALPDPVFELELMDATNTMSGKGFSPLPGQVGATRYRFSQPIPGWRKRELGLKEAEADASQTSAMRDASWSEIAFSIEAQWLKYYANTMDLALNIEALTLLRSLEEFSLTRYKLGMLPQQSVLRMQREITAQRLSIIELTQKERVIVSQLNGLLGRPANADFATPTSSEPLTDSLDFSTLLRNAEENNPEIHVAERGVELARAERERTYQDRLPDFSLGVRNNRPNEGEASWDVMFEVMIPLQLGSRRSKERESEHRLSAAKARLSDAYNMSTGKLGAMYSIYQQSVETLKLLRDALLPQAQATRDASRAALTSNKVDFDTVIEAELQLIDIRVRQIQAELEARTALAEIKYLTGEYK